MPNPFSLVKHHFGTNARDGQLLFSAFIPFKGAGKLVRKFATSLVSHVLGRELCGVVPRRFAAADAVPGTLPHFFYSRISFPFARCPVSNSGLPPLVCMLVTR